MKLVPFSMAVVVTTLAMTASADKRDVQVRDINTATGVVELYNFGDTDIDMSGWRFCTHDVDQRRRYSFSDGFDGTIIEAGTSIFIHYESDGPNDPDHFNLFDLGEFAFPLVPDVYAMQIYFPGDNGFVDFGDGTLIADHLQWSIDGQDNDVADERSDEAVTGGVWTGEMDWIVTSASTTYIRLTDITGGVLHGPKNYDSLDVLPDCNNNGIDDFIDVNFGGSEDTNGNGIPDECEGCAADIDGDGDADGDDFFGYLDLFVAGDARADIDGDGDRDADDFFMYLDAFVQGC